MLSEQQIPTPGTLEYQRTGSTRRYHPGYECKWATNTVVHILENREYTGCLVNFKTEKPSYKVKHSIENPVEKQAIFENHHEPIIDKETWERVQELRKQRKRPNRYDEVGLFSVGAHQSGAAALGQSGGEAGPGHGDDAGFDGGNVGKHSRSPP